MGPSPPENSEPSITRIESTIASKFGAIRESDFLTSLIQARQATRRQDTEIFMMQTTRLQDGGRCDEMRLVGWLRKVVKTKRRGSQGWPLTTEADA